MRPRIRSTRAGFLLCALLAACSEDSPSPAPSSQTRPAGAPAAECRNLLLVTLDTTRADRLGCYGHEGARTPVIDRLASEGVLFERAFSATPITLPSHATILTGLHPFHHGARNNGTHYLLDEVPTLAESLSEAGFATGAFVSAIVLQASQGLDQGFDSYDDQRRVAERAEAFMYSERSAEATVERALEWLARRGYERWFLWVHLFDPHANYEPPEPYASEFAHDLYDGEIAYVDAQVGRLIERLRETAALDETLVALTADHGESLGEHGELTHAVFVYDATTRVPFVLRHPALAGGARVEEVVGGVDFAPTALGLLGVSGLEAADGRDLSPLVRVGGSGLEARPAYSESMSPYFDRGWAQLRSLRSAGERYVRAPRSELYDLTRDPGELDDLAAGEPERVARTEARLRALLPENEAGLDERSRSEVDAELRSKLEALGYVADDASERRAAAGAARPDPKDRVELALRHNDASLLAGEGRLAEAEALFRSVLADDPGAIMTRQFLASVLKDQGRAEEARELLVAIAGEPGFSVTGLLQLAELEQALGLEVWRERLATARLRAPRNPAVPTRAADWELRAGRLEQAFASFTTALELDPEFVPALIGMGDLLCRVGRHEEAAPLLGRATELDPSIAQAWFNRGVALGVLGRGDEALEHYRRAAELDPAHLPARVNLGGLQAQLGQVLEAEASYRDALRVDPTSIGALYGLGVLLLGRGRAEEAAALFERATVAHPTRPAPWRQLAAARRAGGNWEGALAAAERTIELAPNELPARFLAALACGALGRDEAARGWLEQVRGLAPERYEQAVAGDPGVAELVRRLAR